MMYKRKELHEELCLLSVSPRVLDIENVVVSDRNAAVSGVFFGTDDDVLGMLDYDEVHAVSWNHDDYYRKLAHRQTMQAEVLVPGSIAPEYIQRVYVSCQASKDLYELSYPNVEFVLKPSLFFQAAP